MRPGAETEMETGGPAGASVAAEAALEQTQAGWPGGHCESDVGPGPPQGASLHGGR